MERKLCLLLTAAVVLLCASAAEEDEEEAVLEALRVCSEGFKPTDDDLTEISKGELKSDVSKAVITCWFKGAGVMQDKMFQVDKAVTFLRALTPGNPNNDNVAVMKKLSEKCASSVNGEPMDDKSEEKAAVMIYDCMVREGRTMRLTLEEGNGRKDMENGTVTPA